MNRPRIDRSAVSRADMERALGRYRPLFDSVASGWDAFIDTLSRPLPSCIWANPSRIDAKALTALAADEPVGRRLEPIPWLPGALRLPAELKAGQQWWYCAGLAHAQELVSQLPVRLMDLAPGQRVLDLCAAPGGKTSQIALALGNRGTLLANDFSPERIAALQGNLDRVGVVNCSTTWCDGGNYPVAAGGFDRILVDAPCSSEGTLRRNLSLVARLGPERVHRMAGRQRALLRKAVQLCRPGGRIVYSTCTFAPEENELIVAEALEGHAGRLQVLPAGLPGLVAGPGVTRWAGRELDRSLARCLRIWPQAHDSGGFFIAVLEKTRDAHSPPQAEPLVIDGTDGHDWLRALGERYGLDEGVWTSYRLHRQTRRGLHLAAADHWPPALPKPQGSGLFFQRTNIRPPKLTTAGALLVGAQATRNHIELTAAQRDSYLRREEVTPSAAQTGECTPGQVLVRYRGYTLGVALLHRSGTLESLFPRRWSCAGA
jgi:16S rRNA C967 or C1407 C5-methylase (RsmB/RsmF family)/NOL1/NOP2/fmu family ribosome biogenesis protein